VEGDEEDERGRGDEEGGGEEEEVAVKDAVSCEEKGK
jgi:hypothetical protein